MSSRRFDSTRWRSLMSTTRPARPDDLAALAHLAGPHQEVLHLARRALDPLLQLVVAPRRARLQRGDDRGDEPVRDVGGGGFAPVGGRDRHDVARRDGQDRPDRCVPGDGAVGELELPADHPEGLARQLADLARGRRGVGSAVRRIDDPQGRFPPDGVRCAGHPDSPSRPARFLPIHRRGSGGA